MAEFIQDLAVFTAVAALLVTLWQARRTVVLTRQANAGPVIASVFNQFRDDKFRRAIEDLRSLPQDAPSASFHDLAKHTRNHAFTVCYFFEYIGLLVAFGHLDSDLVIGTMSSQLVDVWKIMRPWIIGERKARSEGKDGYGGKEFLPYYENLVALIVAERGEAPIRIRHELKVQRLASSSKLAAEPNQQASANPKRIRNRLIPAGLPFRLQSPVVRASSHDENYP